MFKELLPLLEGRTMILTAAKIGDALTPLEKPPMALQVSAPIREWSSHRSRAPQPHRSENARRRSAARPSRHPLCQKLRPRPFRRLRGIRLAWRRTSSRSRLPRPSPPRRCKAPRRKWDGAMKTKPLPSRWPRKTPATTTTMIHARSDHEENQLLPAGAFLPVWPHGTPGTATCMVDGRRDSA
jgi:hypothetical protein